MRIGPERRARAVDRRSNLVGAERADTELAGQLTRVARSLREQGTVERTLRVIVDTAPDVVEGARHAGFTTLRGRTLESPAYTDDLAAELDRVQNEVGEGPCLTAAGSDEVLRIDDMAAEQRWPRFAKRAAGLGVGSMLACGLRTDGFQRAALHLHSRRPGAFTGTTAQVASLYAEHASMALGNAAAQESLRAAITRRQVIGEATGILMERHRIDSGSAFTLLAQASQRLNVKLKDIAEHVVHSGQDPRTVEAGDLPSAR
jgi:transcriptional regulator with GAF, ATPase, and Fis domain